MCFLQSIYLQCSTYFCTTFSIPFLPKCSVNLSHLSISNKAFLGVLKPIDIWILNRYITNPYFFPLIDTPVDPCYPSPCGDNAICNKHRTRERAATCVCIEGYFGDPFLSCRPECTQNNDCPTNRVCKNQKCVDPCPGLCGINAVCSVSNHRPSCDCLQGYTGNPSVSCNLSKIFCF